MRLFRRAVVLVVVIALAPASYTMITTESPPSQAPQGKWRSYGSTLANTKYSPLDQINATNVGQLRVAWRWKSPDHEVMERNPRVEPFVNESTPIMIGDLLYVSTALSEVAAIDAVTGRTVWVHDPKIYEVGTPPNLGFVHRGVAHWADGTEARGLSSAPATRTSSRSTRRPATRFQPSARMGASISPKASAAR
jgi:glucose dehydrogenase